MRKRILIISTFLSVVIATPAFANIGVSIDGKQVPFSSSSGTPFIDENGRTLVPLRAAMEAFGCSVNWDEPTKTATVIKENTIVTITAGKSYLFSNGTRIENDSAAKIVNGRVYLPIRAVLEAFGASVGWDQPTQTVIATTKSNKTEYPTWRELRKTDKPIHEYVVNGTPYDYGDGHGASFCIHVKSHNDVWADIFIDDHSLNMDRFLGISNGEYYITDNNRIKLNKSADEFFVKTNGSEWTLVYGKHSLTFHNITKDGNYISEGVRMVVYPFTDGSFGAFINATELAEYWGINSTAVFDYDSRNLIFNP